MYDKFLYDIEGNASLNVDGIESGLKNIEKNLSKVKLGKGNRIEQELALLKTSYDNVNRTMKDVFSSKSEANAHYKAVAEFDKARERFKRELVKGAHSGVVSTDFIKGLDSQIRAVDNFSNELSNAQKNINKHVEKINDSLNNIGYNSKIKKITADDILGDTSKITQEANQISGSLKRTIQSIADKTNTGLKVDFGKLSSSRGNQEYNRLINSMNSARAKMKGQIVDLEGVDGSSKKLKELKKDYDALGESVKRFPNAVKAFDNLGKHTKSIDELIKKKEELFKSDDFKKLDLEIPTDLDGLKALKSQLDGIKDNKAKEEIESLTREMEEFDKVAAKASTGNEVFGQRVEGAERLQVEVEGLKNSLLQFFSLTNTLNLFKRSLREAVGVVKELDASMTEIAVVSDYTLGDIWKQRLDYSDAANELGARTVQLIDATKLYIQQGLDAEQASIAGIETTKMARIANLDGAEATNLMTAALRGFNLEMEQAAHVNDVFSNLAAKSAADTQEIATALSKTASIAHSANSSFENTSAFLTQIIETTRERAETAGTSLKTIIARFQELKKPISEIQEVDGEIVDANQVEKALRSAGVAARDASGQFKDFDDIIFELSAKWDTLDTMTQRYIATAAAGARQQSRFLALLSNNERLLELAGYANNADGAGTEQFEKTLDSLESKLAKLKNNLDIFFTNFLSNDMLKGAIGAFTKLLELINNTVGALANSENRVLSLAGSFSQLALTLMAFTKAHKLIMKGGGKLIESVAGGLAGKAGQDAFSKLGEKMLVGTGVMGVDGKEIFKEVVVGADSAGAEAGEGFIRSFIGSVSSGNFSFKGLFKNLLDDATLMFSKLSNTILGSVNKKMTGASLGIFGATQGLKILVDKLQEADKISSSTANNLTTLLEVVSMTAGVFFVGARAAAAFGVSLSMLSGGLLLGVGAVVALVATAIKNMESNAEKLENLNERTRQYSNALNDVRTEQKELASSYGEYSGMLNSLDNLTRGTREWKEQLFEVNQATSELLEKYPKLQVERGSDGVSKITEESYKALEDELKRQEDVRNRQVLMARARASSFEGKLNLKDLDKDFGSETDTIVKARQKAINDVAAVLDNLVSEENFGKPLTRQIHDSLASNQKYIASIMTENEKLTKQIQNQTSLDWQKVGDRTIEDILGVKIKGLGLDNQLENVLKDVLGFDSKEIEEQFGGNTREMARAVSNLITDAVLETDHNEIAKALTKQFSDAGEIDIDSQAVKNLMETYGLTEDIIMSISDDLQATFEDAKETISGLNISSDLKRELSQLPPLVQVELAKIIDSAEEAFVGGGQQLAKVFSELSEGLDASGIEDLIDALASADLSTAEGIDAFFDSLVEVGIEIDKDKMGDLAAALKSTSGEAERLAETLREMIPTIDGALEKIRNDQDISAEEFSQMASQGLINQKDFVQMPSGDYRMLYGSQQVEQGIMSNYFQQASAGLNARNQQLSNMNAAQSYFGRYDPNYEDWTARQQRDRLAGFAQQRPDLVGATSQQIQNPNMTQESELTDMLGRIFNTLLDQAKRGEVEAQREGDYDSLRKGYMMMDKPSDIGKAAREQYSVDYDSEGLKAAGEAMLAVTKNAENLKNETEALEKALRSQDDAAIQSAMADLEKASALEEVKAHYEEYIDALYDAYDALQNTAHGSDEYTAALDEMAAALSDMLGMNIGPAFLEDAENMDLLSQAMDGNADAWARLAENALFSADNVAAAGADIGMTADQIDTAIKSLDGMEFDIDGNLDATQVFEALEAVGMSTVEISNLLQKLGGTSVKFNLETQSQNFNVPTTTSSAMVADMTGDRIQMRTYKMTVPRKLTGSFTSGAARDAWKGLSGPRRGGGGGRRGGGGGKKGGGGKGKKGGGGKKGGKKDAEKEVEPWVQAYDWLYNLVNKTNDVIRKKAKLEQDYEKILRRQGVTLKEALENREKQNALLKQAAALTKEQYDKRKVQMDKYLKENQDLNQYATYKHEVGYVEIDWDKIEKLSDTKGNNETGERIEEYISELEKIADLIKDTEDQLSDIEDQIYNLAQRGKESFTSLEGRVTSALEKQRRDEIEELEKINSTLIDANSKVLERLQNGIDEYRRNREEEKAREEIAKNERRLGLMMTDTSKANQLDILNMQKTLEEQREALNDSLIDRTLDELSKQHNEAVEQRERQIDLAREQLDWDIKQGLIAAETNKILTEAMLTGNPNQIVSLLRENDMFSGMATLTRQEWQETLENEITKGFDYWISQNSLSSDSNDLAKNMKGKSITFRDASGNKLTGVVQADGKVKVGNKLYSDVMRGSTGEWIQATTGKVSNYQAPKPKPKPTPAPPASKPQAAPKPSNEAVEPKIGGWVKVKPGARFRDGQTMNEAVRRRGFDSKRSGGFYVYQRKGDDFLLGNGGPSRSPNWTGWINKKYLLKFKKGGLADFTGPAWLDGTKTRPELILNSQDTENFLDLTKLLREMKGSGSKNVSSQGDLYLNFNIDAEIADSYSVDELINKIQDHIKKEASYRNVNVLGFPRR